MGATTFSGPVRTGKYNGIPAQDTRGTLVAAQRVTVTEAMSGASSIILPPNTSISDMTVYVYSSATANTQGILVRVGTTTDAIYYANIKVSGANGIFRPGTPPNATAASAKTWVIGTGSGQQRLFIDVTAAASAGETTEFEGLLEVRYFQRS